MKLQCSLELVSLESEAQGMPRRKGKGVRSLISLAKKPGGDVYLHWYTEKNKAGNKYKVKENVEKIFGKFISEGKSTLRLISPPVDLFISKTNAIDLKRLMCAVKLANAGEKLEGKGILSSTAPIKTKQIEKVKTKMTVLSKKDYPLTTNFPTTLLTLSVHNCMLSRFDTRMFNLLQLTEINLSDNKIKSIPPEIHRLKNLIILNLEKNKLEEIPSHICDKNSALKDSLRCLLLSHNVIKNLPKNICDLVKLQQLCLNSNKLTSLPVDIGSLKLLNDLQAANNQIKVLPGSIIQLKLKNLDLSNNSFMETGIQSTINEILPVPSLQELVAKIIKTRRIHYTENEISKYMQAFLLMGKKCVICGSYSFRSRIRILRKFILSEICETVSYVDDVWRGTAPLETTLCSEVCFQKLSSNLY